MRRRPREVKYQALNRKLDVAVKVRELVEIPEVADWFAREQQKRTAALLSCPADRLIEARAALVAFTEFKSFLMAIKHEAAVADHQLVKMRDEDERSRQH